MTKSEYMKKLSYSLRRLPKEDFNQAIDYFEEYSYGGYAGGSCGDRRDRRSGSADPKSPGWIGDIRIQSLLRRSRNYVCIWNFLFLEMASL